ncbi:E3 ubiquitin-protein ligase ubr5 [Desmophyllum pertusum]|uniref:E3 ubiquitin-protein ligase ubr5 n=1 Tax=Desmophyllum pertusum TaxID=174260 RepID=A0A9W9ZCP1_9CNID|nr:E3 ubiquitin-protein ligase ubr5 [Desmophyllum pertusum]
MSNSDRQDLVYFWTSSPPLPASEEGFQPKPSVRVKPAHDHHFLQPTHAFLGSTSHSTLLAPFSRANFFWLSRLRHLDLCRI